jgi:hypothetical protein
MPLVTPALLALFTLVAADPDTPFRMDVRAGATVCFPAELRTTCSHIEVRNFRVYLLQRRP